MVTTYQWFPWRVSPTRMINRTLEVLQWQSDCPGDGTNVERHGHHSLLWDTSRDPSCVGSFGAIQQESFNQHDAACSCMMAWCWHFVREEHQLFGFVWFFSNRAMMWQSWKPFIQSTKIFYSLGSKFPEAIRHICFDSLGFHVRDVPSVTSVSFVFLSTIPFPFVLILSKCNL